MRVVDLLFFIAPASMEIAAKSFVLSNTDTTTCGGDQNNTPAIAINAEDMIMVVWENDVENLATASWKAGSAQPNSQGCALADWQRKATNPRLATLPDGEFVLVFDDGKQIFMAEAEARGDFNVVYQETGRMPDVFVDTGGAVHVAWCEEDGQIDYQGEGASTKILDTAGCINRPVLGQDAEGTMHLLWHAAEAEQSSGQVISSDLIYESRLVSGVWTNPIIVDHAASGAQPVLAGDPDGVVHLVWDGSNAGVGQINYANFRVYECAQGNLNTQGQVALDVALSGKYRPEDDLVPYCHNRFDSLLILPTTDPAFSDNPPTLNGAFDDVSKLIQDARYEVLLSTMWYESDDTGTSPGIVLGQGVKALYDKVKANPERYPRGMTVRILLGNPPEFTLSNLISQVWNVFQSYALCRARDHVGSRNWLETGSRKF